MKAPWNLCVRHAVGRNTGFHEASAWLVMVVGIMKVT